MAKPLDGLKVIDLTSAMSGPFCTMILADYGADVIKVEPPAGDQARTWGPLDEATGESEYFAIFNRDKKSVSINLKDPAGKAMLFELLQDADLLVENFKPGVTKKLGIDYEAVRAHNPSILYASASGFGQTGPLSHRPCYDIVAQAMSGILDLTGYPDQDPVKVGPCIIDHTTGLYLVIGILMALHHRDVTGEGQYIDVAMLDSAFSITENMPTYVARGHGVPQRRGCADPSITPFDCYRCKDGFLVIGIGNDALWETFCKTAGLEDLLEDPRFTTNWDRTVNYTPDLKNAIAAWCAQHTKAEIEHLMDEAGIPCSPVMNMKEAMENPQIAARDMMVRTEHPLLGEVDVPGCVVKLSKTPGSVDAPAPLLGQNNRDVLGLSPEEEQALIEQGVLGK